MSIIRKFLVLIIRFLAPAITHTLLTFGYGYLGVFIEDDKYLLLTGGYNNLYVFVSFFVISNLLTWVIVYFIFKYQNIFKYKVNYILAPVISTLTILFSLLAYYLGVFYRLTGLILTDMDFLFSNSLNKEILIIILSIINFIVLTSLISNIVFILVYRKNLSKNPALGESDDKVDKSDEDAPTSNFEDSISI